ncbi:putative DNA-binding protein [Liquorilactobacillus sicerae]|uniref:putative DNA-binding protein n=1 Tax=Liquorilactobacillus sicerae TaxID=1416943 RepID=UPI0024811ECD|nr:putative DNA-binding protein [Liquorilactobacillus sicerae]
MTIEKTNRVNGLLDFYEPLLTEKQIVYIVLYYRDDLSLGEIAENYHVSRQAVYDNIKRTELILEKYEEKLHLFQQYQSLNLKLDELKAYVQQHYRTDGELLTLVDQLENMEE